MRSEKTSRQQFSDESSDDERQLETNNNNEELEGYKIQIKEKSDQVTKLSERVKKLLEEKEKIEKSEGDSSVAVAVFWSWFPFLKKQNRELSEGNWHKQHLKLLKLNLNWWKQGVCCLFVCFKLSTSLFHRSENEEYREENTKMRESIEEMKKEAVAMTTDLTSVVKENQVIFCCCFLSLSCHRISVSYS